LTKNCGRRNQRIPTYGGYVTESGFYLTRRNYCFKKSISETICRGLFHSTHKGTSIELEVHIAPTMKRVLVLGVSCAAIAVPIAFVAIFWGNELPQPTYFLALVAVGLVMFLIGMIGAGLMIVCFLLVSAVVVRIVASRFRTEMMKR
jgi:hypothetical protein